MAKEVYISSFVGRLLLHFYEGQSPPTLNPSPQDVSERPAVTLHVLATGSMRQSIGAGYRGGLEQSASYLQCYEQPAANTVVKDFWGILNNFLLALELLIPSSRLPLLSLRMIFKLSTLEIGQHNFHISFHHSTLDLSFTGLIHWGFFINSCKGLIKTINWKWISSYVYGIFYYMKKKKVHPPSSPHKIWKMRQTQRQMKKN